MSTTMNIRFVATAVVALALAPCVGAQQPFPQPPGASRKSPESENRQRIGFGIVLVFGDMKVNSTQDAGVPVAARKALTDMQDFLPYKSYQMLDSQWVLCCGSTSPAVTRMRGPAEQEYEVQIQSSASGVEGKLFVQFLLRDHASLSTTADDKTGAREGELQKIAELEREEALLRVQTEKTSQLVDRGLLAPGELARQTAQYRAVAQQLETAKQSLGSASRRGGVLIDTSFRMDVGETVVVGTSRVKGGTRALIAILTAAPQATTRTR